MYIVYRLSVHNIFVSAQYFEKTLNWILTKFCICIDIDDVLLSFNFRDFSTELWPLNDVRISFPLNILNMNK